MLHIIPARRFKCNPQVALSLSMGRSKSPTAELAAGLDHQPVGIAGFCRVRRRHFAFFEGFDLTELLRATAWRTSALKADASISSPSWMSIARRTFPSRLELKRRAGSFRNAPWAKVSFTAFL